MGRKVQITGLGGIDRLSVSEDAPAEPGPGEIRIRHDAIGVSFIDIYHRTGLYPLHYRPPSAWKAPAWLRRLVPALHGPARPRGSDFRCLSKRKCIIDLDTEVSNGVFDLGVSKQNLNSL